MNSKEIKQIKKYLKGFYSEKEYINIVKQTALFQEKKDKLSDYKILNATPVFRNTLVTYLPLLAANMELYVGYGNGIPYDQKVVDFLNKIGIKTIKNGSKSNKIKFDFIIDCGGVNANFKSKFGYVELTRSGFYKYENSSKNIFLADNSLVKSIETALGTGDGFMRGMQAYGFNSFANKNIMIFGFGKVGFGIAMYCHKQGASVTIVDDLKKVEVPDYFKKIDRFNSQKINNKISDMWAVVSVTGIKDALVDTIDMEILANSKAIVVNMGIEDEYGEKLNNERVLNNNMPLNFVLDEPTHLKFIAPTFALCNYGLLKLLKLKKKGIKKGLIEPSKKLNTKILDELYEADVISEDLNLLMKMAEF